MVAQGMAEKYRKLQQAKKLSQMLSQISFLLTKTLDAIQCKAKSIQYRSITSSQPNSFFYATSRVVNLARNKSCISVGSNSHVLGELLTFAHAGKISIGDYCYIGELSRIWSAAEVKIGNRVLISHNVNIHDTNSHPIDPTARHIHFKEIVNSGHPKELVGISSAPVTISDDVWIGFNATILKGVTIGAGAIVGACSVVTSDIPESTVFAGNPAKFIRRVFD